MIVCPDNQTVNTEPSQAYSTVVWTDPQVIDNSGQIPTITCDADSGSQFGIGENKVICQAVDPTGNQATCTFTVKIEGKNIISHNKVMVTGFEDRYLMIIRQRYLVFTTL